MRSFRYNSSESRAIDCARTKCLVFVLCSQNFSSECLINRNEKKNSETFEKRLVTGGTSLAYKACVQRFLCFAFLSLAALQSTTTNARSKGLPSSRTRSNKATLAGPVGSARSI